MCFSYDQKKQQLNLSCFIPQKKEKTIPFFVQLVYFCKK